MLVGLELEVLKEGIHSIWAGDLDESMLRGDMAVVARLDECLERSRGAPIRQCRLRFVLLDCSLERLVGGSAHLVYQQGIGDRGLALRVEKRIKRLAKRQKEDSDCLRLCIDEVLAGIAETAGRSGVSTK